MPSRRIIYRERSWWGPWISLLFWGAILGSLAAGVAGGGTQGSLARMLYAGGILGLAGFIWTFLAGLTVDVTRDGVRLGLGNGRLVRKFVAFAEIRAVESVTYHPLREFGGWGVRGWGTRTAWTASGDRAVVLHLTNGHRIYVGSANPQRLEERIRTTMEQRRRG